jgi:hypothetical protein
LKEAGPSYRQNNTLGLLLKLIALLSLGLGGYFGYKAHESFHQVYFLLFMSFLMAGIGVSLYFVLGRYLDRGRDALAGVSNLDDILFIFFMCLSFVFLNESVYYRDLGFFLSLAAAFFVLVRRCAFWSSKALESRRIVNVLEGYALGVYVILSPYYLNFVPRWWDIYYAYSVFHNALKAGGFNVIQTYHGFPLYYAFNSLLTLVGFGTSNDLMYIPVNCFVEATAMIAVYMLARKLLNERAAQIALLVTAMTTLYVLFILTALDFSLTLMFFVLYLVVARGSDMKSMLAGIGLIGISLLLYHPSGAITVDLSLMLLLFVELLFRRKLTNVPLILAYTAISVSYTLYVAGSTFSFLLGGVTGSSTSPYANFGASPATAFTYYWIIYYLPLTIPLIFGAYFLAHVLLRKRDRLNLFFALFPVAFAFLSLAQLSTNLGLAETTLDGFIPVAVVFAIGASFDRLSRRRLIGILSVAVISLVFFTSLIAGGDNLYLGKPSATFEGSPAFGTTQQESALALFSAIPPQSIVYPDGITSTWAIGRLSLIGEFNIPLVLNDSLGLSSYERGSYLAYSTTLQSLSRNAAGGHESLFANVTLASTSNDIIYSSGGVAGVYVR